MKKIIKILQDIEDSKETMKKYDLICSLGGVVSLLNLKINRLEKNK